MKRTKGWGEKAEQPASGTNGAEYVSGEGEAQEDKFPVFVFPPRSGRPCFRSYKYKFQNQHGAKYESGVYLHTWKKAEEPSEEVEGDNDDKGEDGGQQEDKKEILVDDRFAPYGNILGIPRTTDGDEHSYLLEFRPNGPKGDKEELRLKRIPQELLVGKLEPLLKELRRVGFDVFDYSGPIIRKWLNWLHPRITTFLTTVKTVGWHSPETFVLPTQIIGDKEGILTEISNEGTVYGTGGTFEEWQNSVATWSLDNNYLMFSLSLAFVGPLLKKLNKIAVAFHLVGESTIGKSTAGATARSVWGPVEFENSWLMTPTGLELACVNCCDTIIILDELKQAKTHEVADAIHMFDKGEGKTRSNVRLEQRAKNRWRGALLSTGEQTIPAFLAKEKIVLDAGEQVRLIDVPIKQGAYGLFNHLHGTKSGAEFSGVLKIKAVENYGWAGPQFVQWIIDHPEAAIEAKLNSIEQSFQVGLNPQQQRMARSFALVALAGELAIMAGILPWKAGQSESAVESVFANWKEGLPKGSKSLEDDTIWNGIQTFLNKYRSAQFPNIDPDPTDQERTYQKISGYYQDQDDGGPRLYCFTPDGLVEAAGGVFDTKRIAKALYRIGAIPEKYRGKPAGSLKRRFPGGEGRLWHIDPTKLETREIVEEPAAA